MVWVWNDLAYTPNDGGRATGKGAAWSGPGLPSSGGAH